MVLAGADGQIRPGGVQGVYHADTRVLSAAVLLIDGREPSPRGHASAGPGVTRFEAAVGTIDVARTRRVRPGVVEEQIELTAAENRHTTVSVATASDLSPIELVRFGRQIRPRAGVTVEIQGDLTWPVTLEPGRTTRLRWSMTADDPQAAVTAGRRGAWSRPTVGHDRLGRLVDRSLDDLETLRLTTPADGGDTFLAAGAPWFLTLFGRDSIWAARMLLPLGTDLAAGTLRVLARRQGTRTDPATGEAPGKVMHELRRPDPTLDGQRLPAVYYGTVDATPLWISLLHDAWRWGHPPAEIAAMLPSLDAALAWLDGDGFVRYVDPTGRGLANQGWKDSAGAVLFADGRRAEPPIALAEVQGYAYRALLDGAALLDAFDRPGGEHWRRRAAALAGRFRAGFWVGGLPAMALDRSDRPVDSLTSNIGHLLGTGLLTAEEEGRVAAALCSAAMTGRRGLRTMSATDRGFDPLSYHCGSIWPHDTAIVAAGLAGAGFAAGAARLIEGLLTAAEAFGCQLPELYADDAPYPNACHPQAWSAAAAVLILRTWLGLDPDVPAGVVRLRPLPHCPPVTGLRIAGHPIGFDGIRLTGLPPDLSVEQGIQP